MSDNDRKLYGYTGLRPGAKILSVETIPTETQIMADKYLCMVVEQDGEQKRVMIPVTKIMRATPCTSEMLKMCADGNDFFNIQEIAARDRGEPFVLALEHDIPTTRVALNVADDDDETDNTN